jgi:RNA polymerase sigma-70 factor (ECF subfamily)
VGLSDDASVIVALRAGHEATFVALVEQWSAAMLRVAMLHVSNRAIAEEVVQDAWMGVVTGIGRFEARSSLRTWIFRIVTNRAMTRGQRERRSVPLSALEEEGDSTVTVDSDRFLEATHRWGHHWARPPREWAPEDRLLSKEAQEVIRRAIDELPPRQRAVITLRDEQGVPPSDVCVVLDLSEANQRVLLHRARAAVRARLEGYLDQRLVSP